MSVETQYAPPLVSRGSRVVDGRLWASDASAVDAPYSGRIMLMSGALDANYRLKTPIFATIDREDDGSYLVYDEQFLQWGHGASADEAENDYRSTLCRYFELVAEGASDSSSDAKELRRLQRYISIDE